jgi:molybdate transport system substrate-binding protein
MRLPAFAVRSAVVVLTWLFVAVPARAEDIKVFSSVAMRAVVEDIAQRFEKETKHHVVTTFGLAAAMKSRIEGGEAFDLVIITPAQIDDLIKQGKAAAGSRAVIARTGLGLMVSAGLAEARRRHGGRLQADAAGDEVVDLRASWRERRGLRGHRQAARHRAGARGQDQGPARRARTSTPTSRAGGRDRRAARQRDPAGEGCDPGGVFPAEVQTYIVMAGATSNTASAAARSFLARLTSSASDAVITAKGMERVKP